MKIELEVEINGNNVAVSLIKDQKKPITITGEFPDYEKMFALYVLSDKMKKQTIEGFKIDYISNLVAHILYKSPQRKKMLGLPKLKDGKLDYKVKL